MPEGTALGELTDALLLDRFIRQRDEAAFAVLVRRHGPMVLGVCRRVLRDAHEAEDAFQATFLVLVRKGAAIARPELLGNWLHGVAYRTARTARARAAPRRDRERRVVDMPVEATNEVVWRDLRPVLDAEVNRLPELYRVPFVLCYLEGKTNEEVACCLSCPKGTVLSRLARARERLRIQLTRRGLALSAGLLATALAEPVDSTALAAGLIESTNRAALLFAAGRAASAGAISANVLSLTTGVLRSMFLAKLKTVGMMVLLVSALAGVAAFLGYRGKAAEARMQAADAPRDSDERKVQGTWYTVAVESHGRKAPLEVILAKDVRLVIAGERWTLKEMQGDPDKGYTVRLDASKKPGTIDFVYESGENKGRTSLGIYELNGNTLRVCVGEPGDPRPTEFDGGGTRTLEVFQREKPKPAKPGSGQPI
jgi:RNA polymerase sigma factor (sigma-70 family)